MFITDLSEMIKIKRLYIKLNVKTQYGDFFGFLSCLSSLLKNPNALKRFWIRIQMCPILNEKQVIKNCGLDCLVSKTL